MTYSNHNSVSRLLKNRRMAISRKRLRLAGLRRVQILLPNIKDSYFVKTCAAQAKAIAKGDPAGDDLLQLIELSYEWP